MDIEKKTILFVDDMPCILMILENYFEPKNWNVVLATNSQEAISIINSVPVDVIVVDFVLKKDSELSGVQLLEYLHSKKYKMLLIGMTGYAAKNKPVWLEKTFIKPFDSSDLIKYINAKIKLF